MKILAVDPGITTGMATYIDGQWNTFVCPKSFEAVYQVVMSGIDWDLIIVEGFATPGLIASYGIDTVELIGAVKALCWWAKLECVVQYPVERRGNLSDAKMLMQNVLKTKRYQTHQLDAVSHILTYMRKHKEQFPEYVTMIKQFDAARI